MICLPKKFSQKLLKAAKDGEFTVLEMTEMNSEQRRAMLAEYIGKENAKEVNALFEKALVSQQKDALTKWAQQVFDTKEKETQKYKNVMKKINDLDELGMLDVADSDSFMQDLVAEKIGVTVSAEEAKIISEKAEKLEKLSEAKPDNEFGLPNMEYFKARREMFDYLNSLAPSNRLKILSSTVARGNMLFSVKSPVTNIVGNTFQGIQQAMERRLASRRLKGTNPDLVKDYFKYATLDRDWETCYQQCW